MSEEGEVDTSLHNPFTQTGLNPNPTNNSNTKSHAQKPLIFSRDRKTLEKFLRDCLIYISSNIKDFRTEISKSQFILSYIDRGEADSWRKFYVTNLPCNNNKNVTWPTVTELTDNLCENFAKEDQVEESLHKLKTMKQNGQTAKEVINEFRILKSCAKIQDNTLTV